MCPTLLESEDRCLGGMTFFAQCHPSELCGSNGLPVTPNSVTILGRSQFLKSIRHPNLSSYLDIIRSKHERVVVVAEYCGQTLSSKKYLSTEEITNIAYQCLIALSYMNKLGLVHRHLNPENILVNKNGTIQLYNYGLYHMTDAGKYVTFPIGYPKYTAPEVFLGCSVSSFKVDSWSLGMIIAELLIGSSLWPGAKLSQNLRKVLCLIHTETSVFERLCREHNCFNVYENLPENVKDFINSCLEIHPHLRKTPEELLEMPVFEAYLEKAKIEIEKGLYTNLINRSMNELHYLWQVAGGDITMELKKQGLIRSRPPILSLPNLVILLGQVFGQKDTSGLLDLRIVKVSLDILGQRLAHISLIANFPRLDNKFQVLAEDDFSITSSQLPLVIRERDTEYQLHRIILYDRLLQVYPLSKEAIIGEAHKDIPPPVRGAVWAALLNVTGDIQKRYDMIDKETPTHTDRQIEVDIPRCHQYSELLSSSTGHKSLQRLLKAWVKDNPHYVYWQGLDSLTAPFLYLNFSNEARAFACLSAFIPKYLHKFFLKDNSAVIKEYLAKFSQIIAFHDPQLANHLKSINFVPELFAIPWFLTMFSHVFPIHKILHLWDKLLLGESSFPLFVGLAILKQLRDFLLASGFNECILLFSDLPEIDIELCVTDSMLLYQKTPASIKYRKHQYDQSKASSWSDPEPLTENMSRISIDDFLHLIENSPNELIVIDIRNNSQFERSAVNGSINIPFTSIQLSQTQIDTLGPQSKILSEQKDKIVVIIGPNDQNNALFADFLICCQVHGVCSLQGGIYALRSKAPHILVSSH